MLKIFVFAAIVAAAIAAPNTSKKPSQIILQKQLSELKKHPVEGFSAGLVDDSDLYKWEILIMGPPDTL